MASKPRCLLIARFCAVAAACLALAIPLAAQPTGPALLGKGKFLVAGRSLGDPNFSETVVLLLDYNDKGAMGIIINRDTGVKLRDALSGIAGLEENEDTAFSGGPVETSSLMVLIRASEAPAHSTRIFEDIYATGSPEVLQELAARKSGGTEFRLFAGYAGWAATQLDGEVGRGDWLIQPATARDIFSKSPETLWRRLFERGTMQFAGLVTRYRNFHRWPMGVEESFAAFDPWHSLARYRSR